MDISVVIPTYHRPQLLMDCLAALFNQDFKGRYEIIVVSDGPDPATRKMVEDSCFDERLRYFEMPFKKGPAAARNYGWKKACSPLIAFTDDDTQPDKSWLSAFKDAYHQESQIAFSGKVIVPISPAPTDYEKNTAGLQIAEFVTANCCCTWMALQQTGGFDERFSMAWREDSDLHFKLIMDQIPIIHVEEAKVLHPVRNAGWGISLKEQRKGKFNALLYKKFPSLYRQRIQPAPLWNYYLMILSSLFFIVCLVMNLPWPALFFFTGWAVLLARFIYRRLKGTSKTITHILEMICTSVCIPFLSVYWQIYGAWKYRVLFL
jgi:glycosyltransferase involved in cell wall biosynthesis